MQNNTPPSVSTRQVTPHLLPAMSMFGWTSMLSALKTIFNAILWLTKTARPFVINSIKAINSRLLLTTTTTAKHQSPFSRRPTMRTGHWPFNGKSDQTQGAAVPRPLASLRSICTENVQRSKSAIAQLLSLTRSEASYLLGDTKATSVLRLPISNPTKHTAYKSLFHFKCNLMQFTGCFCQSVASQKMRVRLFALLLHKYFLLSALKETVCLRAAPGVLNIVFVSIQLQLLHRATNVFGAANG